MKTSLLMLRTVVLAVFAVSLALIAAAPASAQDVLYVVNNKVGIGTGTPAEMLHLKGAAGTDLRLQLQGPGGKHVENIYYDGNELAGRFLTATGNIAGARYFGFLAYRDQDGWYLPVRFFTLDANNDLQDAFFIGAGQAAGQHGKIGIGTATPSYPIHVWNGAYLSTGGTWTDGSSREYKENIRDLSADEAEATLADLVPVTFKYKNEPTDTSVGFIAEDVPNLVASPDRKGVAPMDVVAVLTKVVQEQQKTIEELKAKVDAIEKQR